MAGYGNRARGVCAIRPGARPTLNLTNESVDTRAMNGDGTSKAPLVGFLASATVAVALGVHGWSLVAMCTSGSLMGGYARGALARRAYVRRGIRDTQRYLGEPQRGSRSSR